jgi:hypothetical protein
MILTIKERENIYNYFQSNAGPQYFFRSSNHDEFVAYYNSMYLIQDTAGAISWHVRRGFSRHPMGRYLEFWGVMQATTIQQDAIVELHKAICGSALKMPPNSAWMSIREKRHLCAGHPANRSHGTPAPQRTFMGRSFGNYNSIQYGLWDAASGNRTHPVFNLRQLLGAYDSEASVILQSILATMKARWP